MSTDFVITSENNTELFRDTKSKAEAKTYSFDFTPWEEDNSTITSATWTVEAGQAAITSKTLSSGIITSLITTTESGGSLIKLVATTSAQIKVVWLDILAQDMKILQAGNDYHLHRRF